MPGSSADRSTWTQTEQALAAIWSNVLKTDAVNLHDSFFLLGGESISGSVCANRVRQTFGVKIKLSMLLREDTTLRSLAAEIDRCSQPQLTART